MANKKVMLATTATVATAVGGYIVKDYFLTNNAEKSEEPVGRNQEIWIKSGVKTEEKEQPGEAREEPVTILVIQTDEANGTSTSGNRELLIKRSGIEDMEQSGKDKEEPLAILITEYPIFSR